MTHLKATLILNPLSPTWLVPKTWGQVVTAWADSFADSGWRVDGSPVVSPLRAIVFLTPRTGAEVTERQLAGLERNWSDRVGGARVESVTIVQSIPSREQVAAELRDQGPLEQTLDAFGKLFGAALAVPLAIATIAGVGYLIWRYHGRGK